MVAARPMVALIVAALVGMSAAQKGGLTAAARANAAAKTKADADAAAKQASGAAAAAALTLKVFPAWRVYLMA